MIFSEYLGIDSDYVIVGLAALVLILFIVTIVNIVQMSKLKKKYKKVHVRKRCQDAGRCIERAFR